MIAVSMMGLSFMNVWLITIDSYIAVSFALKHRTWVTKRRTRTMLVVSSADTVLISLRPNS